MRSIKSARVVSIYSIVFGALSLLGSLGTPENDELASSSKLGLIISIVILLFGIIVTIRTRNLEEGRNVKPLMITLFVLYCLQQVAIAVLFFSGLAIPLLGVYFIVLAVMLEAMIIVPFIYSIKYFKFQNVEKNFNEQNNINKSVSDRILELNNLKQLGLIDEEQYNRAVNNLLEEEQ